MQITVVLVCVVVVEFKDVDTGRFAVELPCANGNTLHFRTHDFTNDWQAEVVRAVIAQMERTEAVPCKGREAEYSVGVAPYEHDPPTWGENRTLNATARDGGWTQQDIILGAPLHGFPVISVEYFAILFM